MGRVHRENVTDWSHAEAIFVRQIQTVQAVDQLGATCDPDLLRMPIENVEGHATKDGITQRWGLFELVTRREFAAGTIPWSPFIDRNFDVVVLVKLTHDLPVARNHRFHPLTFMEQYVPVHWLEFERVTFALIPVLGLATTQVPGIVM